MFKEFKEFAVKGNVLDMAVGIIVGAAFGTIVWAIEVDGFWQTLGVIFIGGPVTIFLATLPIALAQALRAIADVGDTVAAR